MIILFVPFLCYIEYDHCYVIFVLSMYNAT